MSRDMAFSVSSGGHLGFFLHNGHQRSPPTCVRWFLKTLYPYLTACKVLKSCHKVHDFYKYWHIPSPLHGMFKWGIEAAAGYVVYWAPQRPQRKVLNGISINLAVSAGLTVAPTNRHTDRPRYNGNNRPHFMLRTAMRPSDNSVIIIIQQCRSGSETIKLNLISNMNQLDTVPSTASYCSHCYICQK